MSHADYICSCVYLPQRSVMRVSFALFIVIQFYIYLLYGKKQQNQRWQECCEVWENTETWSSMTTRTVEERKGMLCEVQGGDWLTFHSGFFYPHLLGPVWQPSLAIHFASVNLPHPLSAEAYLKWKTFFSSVSPVPVYHLPSNSFEDKTETVLFSSVGHTEHKKTMKGLWEEPHLLSPLRLF